MSNKRPEFTHHIRRDDNVFIVALRGYLDCVAARGLRQEIEELLNGGAMCVVFDCQAFARCLAELRYTGPDQRVFGIACGHPDGNDADHLADDPIHKLLLGRDPVSGAPLASQPTISRFENGARRTVLYRMGRELAACVIERHRRRLHGRARRITIDLDPTDDLTHGAQQLTCTMAASADAGVSDEAEQYLCAAVLRLGKAVAADGTLGLLSRLLPLLRAAFPRARFLVRLDGGFATPEIFDFLDAEPRLDYVVAMAKNAVLQRHAESAMQVARPT